VAGPRRGTPTAEPDSGPCTLSAWAGHPTAHGNDPCRAVRRHRTAIRLRSAIRVAQRREAGPEYGNTCVSSLDIYAAKRMSVHPSAGMPAMVALTRTIGGSNMGRSA
jgi:hypothetical protein